MSTLRRIVEDLDLTDDEVRILPYTFAVAVIVLTAALATVWLMFAAFG